MNSRLGLIERGRIDYSFLTYGAARPVDVLLFMQKYGAATDPDTLSRLLGRWLTFWKGSQESDRSEMLPNLFAGISHFDSILQVLAAKGEHDLAKFFVDEWVVHLPTWARDWVGAGTPFEHLYWLAVTPDNIGDRYPEPGRSELQEAYDSAVAVSDWMGDPKKKWDSIFDDQSGGVATIIENILSMKREEFMEGTYEGHLATRMGGLAQLLKGALPETGTAVMATDRANLARDLSEGFLNGTKDEQMMLKAFSRARQAFEVPVLKMSAPPSAGPQERLCLWYRELINSWAVAAGKQLSELDPRNAEEWIRLVGWLKEALRRQDLEHRFVEAVGIVPRSRHRDEGGVDLFPRFAAALVSDQFFRASVEHATRPEPPAVYDSSQVSWKKMIQESFVEAIVWHARESANAGGRPELAGDNEGLEIYQRLQEAIGD